MIDDELIELAAKTLFRQEKSTDWNPLKNPGDAFELAMFLSIKIIPGKYKGDGCSAESQFWKAPGVTVFNDKGMLSQAMRAVTMVAANIQIEIEKR